MKTTLLFCAVVALLLQINAASRAGNNRDVGMLCDGARVDLFQPGDMEKGQALAALERKLLGSWDGPPCGGDYTFKSDGTLEVQNFTPGRNTLTGTWSIRWDALPPTLILTCKTSDFTQRDTTRPEYRYLGKPREFKLVELNDNAFSFENPEDKSISHNLRRIEEGGKAIQK
jgi:hypothetical protein